MVRKSGRAHANIVSLSGTFGCVQLPATPIFRMDGVARSDKLLDASHRSVFAFSMIMIEPREVR